MLFEVNGLHLADLPTTLARRSLSLGRECKCGHAFEGLPGPKNHRGKVRVIDGVGVMLRFQTEPAVI